MAASLSDKVSKASQNQKRKTKKTTPFASSRRDTSQSFLQSKDGDILNVDRHRVVDHQSCGSNYTSKESFSGAVGFEPVWAATTRRRQATSQNFRTN
jgi:hypothetical protein